MQKKTDDGKTQISLRLTPQAIHVLDVVADREGISRTAVAEMAIRAYGRAQGIEARGRGGEE